MTTNEQSKTQNAAHAPAAEQHSQEATPLAPSADALTELQQQEDLTLSVDRDTGSHWERVCAGNPTFCCRHDCCGGSDPDVGDGASRPVPHQPHPCQDRSLPHSRLRKDASQPSSEPDRVGSPEEVAGPRELQGTHPVPAATTPVCRHARHSGVGVNARYDLKTAALCTYSEFKAGRP